MNALQPQPHHDPSPSRSRSPRVRSRVRKQQLPHQALAFEVSIKLAVNVVLSTVAITALVELIPYNLEQQATLQQLESEVEEVAAKVASLQADFDRHFDPQQALNVMQEQNIRFNPQQRQVVWLNPKTQKAETGSTDSVQQADSLTSP